MMLRRGIWLGRRRGRGERGRRVEKSGMSCCGGFSEMILKVDSLRLLSTFTASRVKFPRNFSGKSHALAPTPTQPME